MTIKRRIVLLCLLLFANGSFGLQAQSSESFTNTSDDELRVNRRLTWTRAEFTQRYEVVIEREEEGVYREHLREFTTALFIQVSLLPGKYRCCVITHGFMNQVGNPSQWVYIEVLPVLIPGQANRTEDISLVHRTDDNEPDQSGEHQKKVNLFLSVAWLPSFTIYDKENFFGQNISLAGAVARVGVVSAGNEFNPGLEFAAGYNLFDTADGEQSHLLSFGLNLSALKRLPGNRAALTFRLGAGYSLLLPDGGAVFTNMGVSFLLFVMEHLYLETGFDYTHWFADTPFGSGSFRPFIGVGFWR